MIVSAIKRAKHAPKKQSIIQFYGNRSVEGGQERNARFEAQWRGGTRGERLVELYQFMKGLYDDLPEEEKARWMEDRELAHAKRRHAEGTHDVTPGTPEQYAE